MKLVLPGIWTFEGLRIGRAYLIEDDRGLTMVDSSEPGKLDTIAREIAQIGKRIDDVHSVVTTHYHTDHAGNGSMLRQRTGATIYAHAIDAAVIDGRVPEPERTGLIQRLSRRLARDMARYPVDHEVNDGETIPVAGGLIVIHSPGHTPGHISLMWPARRLLFAGDAFGNYFGLQLPFWISTHDMDQAKRSIDILAKLDFDHALPGHGSPVLNHAGDKVRLWASRWLDRS